jgi:hypothetical protein
VTETKTVTTILMGNDFDQKKLKTNLAVNETLRHGWLYWTNDGGLSGTDHLPIGSDYKSLGHYGHHNLFMTAADYKAGYLSNLTLFLLPNPGPSGGGGGGGGGGAGGPAGAGRRNDLFERFILPGIQ